MRDWIPNTVNKIEDRLWKIFDFFSGVAQFIFLYFLAQYLAGKWGYETVFLLLLVGIGVRMRKIIKN